MMLNFYDTILNDNIVPETYEVDANFENDKFLVASPGTHYELDYNPIGEDVIGYTNYLRSNYINTSLHVILALIGTDMLENNENVKETFRDTFGTNQDIITTTVNRYFNLLNFNIQKTIVDKSLKNYDSVESINNFVLNEIQAGRPEYAGYGQHTIIIYGYTNDKFIYHNGYINNSANAALWPTTNLEDVKIDFAMSIHFTTQHNCSYHYYNTTNGNGYCLCGLYIHKNHIYNYDYVYNSNNYHKAYCNCGVYTLKLHNYRENLNAEEHCPCGSINPFI